MLPGGRYSRSGLSGFIDAVGKNRTASPPRVEDTKPAWNPMRTCAARSGAATAQASTNTGVEILFERGMSSPAG